MPTTKASKKRRRESKLLPELYENDVGIEGIKTKNVTKTNYSIFQGSMKLTKEDIAKIKKRKVRNVNQCLLLLPSIKGRC